jgi:hypothetical protein
MPRPAPTLTVLFGALIGASLGAACGVADPQPNPPPVGSRSGRAGNTFDHDAEAPPSWDVIMRVSDEGPPRFTSRLHGCAKIRYATLGNVLTSLGVDLASAAPQSAGALYAAAANAYGSPGYAGRRREDLAITTSGAAAELDIFAAAADEVTAALPTLARCRLGGAPGPALFDANNSCNADAITCMIGTLAQPEHVELCNRTVTKASAPAIGKRIAVAALLGAAYTCE